MKRSGKPSPTESNHLYHQAIKPYWTLKIHSTFINNPFSGGHHAN
jgi:hypothetical protein